MGNGRPRSKPTGNQYNWCGQSSNPIIKPDTKSTEPERRGETAIQGRYRVSAGRAGRAGSSRRAQHGQPTRPTEGLTAQAQRDVSSDVPPMGVYGAASIVEMRETRVSIT